MRDHYDFSDSKPNPYAKRMKGQVAIRLDEPTGAFNQDDLWGESALRRLRAARSLTAPQLSSIQQALLAGCPWKPADLGDDGATWPYGNATTINPMLVTLGASPGNSPQAGDFAAPSHVELPPAGSPHRHVYYQDGGGYWDKVRYLARTMLAPAGGGEPLAGPHEGPARSKEAADAYALFGNMNLDTGRSGSASGVTIDSTFANWVLRTIEGRLRPRWLICLGLKGQLDRNRPVREVFESALNLDLNKPHDQYRLLESKYYFRVWEVRTGKAPLTVVFWPQHPSKPPLRDFGRWRDACAQFKERHMSHPHSRLHRAS